jgi:predicted HAD superfamily hydrolase
MNLEVFRGVNFFERSQNVKSKSWALVEDRANFYFPSELLCEPLANSKPKTTAILVDISLNFEFSKHSKEFFKIVLFHPYPSILDFKLKPDFVIWTKIVS